MATFNSAGLAGSSATHDPVVVVAAAPPPPPPHDHDHHHDHHHHHMHAHANVLSSMSNGAMSVVDVFDHDITFDESLLDGVNALPAIPFASSSYDFDGFNSATFDDPFAYPSRPIYDVPAESLNDYYNNNNNNNNNNTATAAATTTTTTTTNHEEDDEPSTAQEQPDNKLLGFSAPTHKARLVDSAGAPVDASMTAELYGMFFVAEDVFGSSSSAGRPLELTCYRRNLWQCSGQITLPRRRVVAVAVADDELSSRRRLPVVDLAASITAVESGDGKPTDIISIPWKSSSSSSSGGGDESAAAAAASRSPAAPPLVHLDLAEADADADDDDDDGDGRMVSLPVSWKRLQFKHATANNGRRKGLQQHYVVRITLLARLLDGGGEYIEVAEIRSGPVIVRGRSPRNFNDSRRDVPVASGGGDRKAERRAASSDSATPVPKTDKGAAVDAAQNVSVYHSLGSNVQPSTEWITTPSSPYAQQQQNSHPSKKPAPSPNPSRPPVPAWSSDPSIIHSTGSGTPATPRSRPPPSTTLPISLSLSEDERSPPANKHHHHHHHHSGSAASLSSSRPAADNDDGEQLYEYFPLSLDDWMPPVDAIYRPHVVHHTIVPPELKAQQVRSRTKRYFSSD